MGKVQMFDIRYENRRNNVYMAGEYVTGRVYLILNEPMKMRGLRVKINGQAHTEWTVSRTRTYTDSNGQTQTETYYETYSANESYINTVITLYGKPEGASGDNPEMAAGKYEFPFTCKIPENCPSSFEAGDGYIRYTCKAIIDRPWRFDVKCTIPFTVVGVVDLNREQAAHMPLQLEQSKQLGCMCCISGRLECEINIPQGGFVPGQSIPLNFQVLNKSRTEISEVTVKFVENVICRAQGDTRSKQRNIASLCGASVAAGDAQDWTGKMILIPPIAPTLKTCSIIEVNYHLFIKINPNGCHSSLKVFIPILIGNIPLRSVYQNAAQQNIITSQPKPSAPPLGESSSVLPSAPPAYSDYPDLPPPAYEEAILGGGEMKGDDEHDSCPTNFKPRYPYYDYLNKK